MRTVISADFSKVDKLFDELKRFQDFGVHAQVEAGSKKLVSHLKTNVAQGKDATGKPYSDIEADTLDKSIAYGGPFKDTRIRREVSSNRTAMNVTGKSIDSIYSKRSGNVTEIVVDDPRATVVFYSNAGRPGNVSKPVRDPLGLTTRNVSDVEFDIIADLIDVEIERIVSGL